MNTPTRNPNLQIDQVRNFNQELGSANAVPATQSFSHEAIATGADFWTGLPPVFGVCPGVDCKGKIHSLPQLNLSSPSRQEILDYFNNTWTMTEVLFSALKSAESYLMPPYHGLRHPLIFYYGHPAVLYVNKLRLAQLLKAPVNPEFEQLFETGVDEMSWDDISKNEMQWPAISEVRHYRAKVYSLVKDLILNSPELAPAKMPIDRHQPAWALAMAFEHERIHLETSSVLMRELSLHLVQPPTAWPELSEAATQPKLKNELISVPPCQVTVGRAQTDNTFGWDNEFGSEVRQVAAFQATKGMISNGEFLEFVNAGGYRSQKFWSEEGWRWRSFRNVRWPTFWMESGPQGLHQFHLRTCFESIELPLAWPAIVNYHEAMSYCRWRSEQDGISYRLLTEAEHHALRGFVSANDTSWRYGLTTGSEGPTLSPSSSFSDVFGNAWQWAEDDFHPLHDFTVHPLYEDFSTPCFDGKHTMIFGGSFISSGGEVGPFARFHFRRHYFQHAGFRIVHSANSQASHAKRIRNGALTAADESTDYESRRLLGQYLFLHYGDLRQTVIASPDVAAPGLIDSFPNRVVAMIDRCLVKEGLKDLRSGRALDVGCAVGGLTFELARIFSKVKGVDLSESFVHTAQQIQTTGRLSYRVPHEGELQTELVAHRPEGIDGGRVEFRQADAVHLPAGERDYDLVLAANLLCRLPSPKSFLSRMSGPRGLVRPGGLLVLISPYTWMEQFTPKEVWLGGFLRSGMPQLSRETIETFLHDEFDLVAENDVPLVILEHARKYQLVVSQALMFMRKGR